MPIDAVDAFERDNSAPLSRGEKTAALLLAISPILAAAAALAVSALLFAGCATKTAALDGTGIQANQYSGLTVFSGSLLSIAQGMEFCETYEDVSTSWWNFGRYNYKRRTTWASSSTNRPPEAVAAAFETNVKTELIFATATTNDCGGITAVVKTEEAGAK